MEIILFSLIACISGTGLGGIIGVYFGKRSKRTIALLLSFAGGVLLAIIFFDLILEAYELKDNLYFVAVSILCGILLVFILNLISDFLCGSKKHNNCCFEDEQSLEALENTKKSRSLLISGIVMLFAVALHNLPSGIAIGTVGMHSHNLGLTLAILIGFHNIPEGIAMMTLLICAGVSKFKAFLWMLLAASTIAIGAAMGLLFGSLNDTLVSFFIAFAGGSILYVTFAEIIPAAYNGNKSKATTIILLAGILSGFLLVNLLH